MAQKWKEVIKQCMSSNHLIKGMKQVAQITIHKSLSAEKRMEMKWKRSGAVVLTATVCLLQVMSTWPW